MKNTAPTAVERVLKLDYTEKDKIWLSEQKSLRIIIGILGISLPALLYGFLRLNTHYTLPLESISHYYYTRVSSIFVIVVSMLAIFLLVYKGKETIDFIFSSIAGIFALCVTLFPTSNISIKCLDPDKLYSVTILRQNPLRENFHYLSAAIFLSCLAYMSLFLFTKSDKLPAERTKGKKLRNKIYRICGVMMVLAMAVIVVGRINEKNEAFSFYTEYHLTYWMETVAVVFFGFSWLTKSEIIIKD